MIRQPIAETEFREKADTRTGEPWLATRKYRHHARQLKQSERSQVAKAAFPSCLVASIALPSRVGEGNGETGRGRGLVKGEKVVLHRVLSPESNTSPEFMNYLNSSSIGKDIARDTAVSPKLGMRTRDMELRR
ncbi:hypothetical protein PAAG_12257 [Paracoccidioides lutzii Pb01]|uniref:Uncharacterized protein n=1 Tax=Paracoccidioides lutzii (strain ATCC MYA-826 / Pb01) TaxID=502779 RepID=A0A0A2V0N4_PARBA|nr:hypothetical protein PAAG_12257 [Paracoccidioides lutzii Pb01]KGQ01063.1 hypothetical protein PAAG_12257 [Paracoccidioides lutzii Pb01]